MSQFKVIEYFHNKKIKNFIKHIGQDNIYKFNNLSLIGIKFDFDKNQLPLIMKRIPFSNSQQVFFNTTSFIQMLNKLKENNITGQLEFDTEISQEDMEELRTLIKTVNVSQENLQKFLNRIEIEYEARPRKVKFFTNKNDHVIIQNNGIIYAKEESLPLTDSVISVI